MKNWLEVLETEEKERRELKPESLCTYGIKALDDSLKYILNNELVVIGADSGQGKTECAINICINNIKRGKSIAYYHLEGGEEEMISRLRWQYICDFYYRHYKEVYIDMDYVAWKTNTIENIDVIREIEAKTKEEMKEVFADRLWLYEVADGVKIDNLLTSLYDFHDLRSAIEYNQTNPFAKGSKLLVDLIIIDHLQYFELTGGQNEIMQTTNILKEVKKVSDIFHVPVILISHLRKKNKDRGIADQEDFYGSSNTPKISTTTIVIHSDNSMTDYSQNMYPTFFRIVKSRVGIRPNYAIKTYFNLTRRRYEDDYELYQISPDGLIKDVPIEPHKLPNWARRSTREEDYYNEP